MKPWLRLIAAFRRFPGVGPKQAERLALHVLRSPVSELEELATALREAKARIQACSRCFNYSDHEVCALCSDLGRDQGLLCVVEEPQDVAAVERSRSYRGLYHVLHGCLSPLDGIGPETIRIAELLARVRAAGPALREVILATDIDTEGDATALYLAEALKPFGVRASRIAQGVPLGGDLDYIDERTLGCALNGRREV